MRVSLCPELPEVPTAQTSDAQAYDASLSDGQLATWRAAEQQLQVGIRNQGRRRDCKRHNDSTQLPADLSLLGSAVPAPHFDGSRIGYVFGLQAAGTALTPAGPNAPTQVNAESKGLGQFDDPDGDPFFG